ncbi:Signal transduction histidine kinase [Algoriphagus faecimaris]|uniref:histidine kinase n=1 Tax=Algoriphagus faecimaris TaxID=686796 RepID=A0A1G6XKP9_9BACT|nr:two-component regulator propeller domain-containing protein [Algoriphagus faecimaris]SDD78778.1 Signal transduction histidine kinase [Algoriphagus faecimaris]
MSISRNFFITLLGAMILIGKIGLVHAQENVSFRQLSVNDGLSQNSAVSISQDPKGFLWIATQEGLNRYDGNQFIIYPKKFNDITQENQVILGKVLADQKGNIWIIPDTNIPELLENGEGNFKPIEGIQSANEVFEDSDGRIWFGTLSGQLLLWNEKLLKAENIWANPSKEIVDITAFKDQLLITFKDEIALFDKSNFNIKSLIKGNESSPFSSALLLKEEKILIGTLKEGLWVADPNGVALTPISEYLQISEHPLDRSMVLDLFQDSQGKIWIATYGKGSFLLDPETREVQNFTYSKQNPRSIHYNDILCLYEDYTGTIWMGSDGAGLSFYDSYLEKFNFYHNQQLPENINIDVVRAIFVDDQEVVWVGTSGKGLTRFDPKSQTWKTFTEEPNSNNSIISNRVMSLIGDKSQVWVGYQDGGLSILDTKTGIFRHFSQESQPQLFANTVWKILKDDQNRFWLCTRNDGLIWFDPEEGVKEQFTHDPLDTNSIPDNNIRTIIQASEDEFWIGTENQGIARLNLKTGKFERFQADESNPKSISSNGIKSLFLSPENDLWIGTNGAGLNRMDLNSGDLELFTSENGLANDVIYGILPDENGDLWLSSNKGISQIQKNGSKFAITNYTNYDGLATEFNTGAYFRHPNGTLYFGSLEGFYWFHAEDISLNQAPPKTAITQINAVDTSLPLTEYLTLSHGQNTLTFSMASMVFSSPDKNQYQYKLEGYDEGWIVNKTNNQARYTNLPAGDYTFWAKSSNYDNIWSEEPTGLSFTILPPWYGTIWAKLIYALIFLIGIFWILNYLRWRWKIQYELKLKEEETKRLLEIDEFKTSFFTNVSHEFRTPLTLIMGPVQRLMKESENPVIKSQLNLIKQNSTRLLNLVDQLLEASKIKTGRLNLKIQKGNLGLLLQTIVMNFFYHASEKGMKLNPSIPLMTEIWFDSDKVEKIIGNLIQNAIKYGKPNTEIKLEAKIIDNEAVIKVKNQSSRKYSQEEKDQLFDKFYKPDQKSEGFGIGLPMVKDLTELHGGRLKLNLDDPEIFEVEIHLPVDKFSFSPKDVNEEPSDNPKINSIENPKNKKEEAPLVLVVEDNEDVRLFLENDLEEYYNLISAKNGKEGIYLAFQKIPDLIISDVMMPELDGIELCKTLKTDEKTSHIPIILLTAKSEEEQMLKGLEVGADDYMIKPFSTRKLLLRMEKLIELRNNLRVRYSGKTEISPREIAVSTTDERFLQKVQEIVDSDLLESNFSVDDFSQKLGMSRMQLHRKLTALTGLSTSAFIRDQRLRKALQKLEKTDDTIAEIAYSVGFSSPSLFNKWFKDTYEITPSEFKLKRRKLE